MLARLRGKLSGAKAPSPATAIACLALFFALGAAVHAAIPEGNTFRGCYDNTPGKRVLYLLDTGESCGQDQVQVSWNQTGPVGPAGPQGATGPAGRSGTSGVAAYSNFFNGLRPNNEYVGLPRDGSRFDLLVNVPAGLYSVTANGDFYGLVQCPRSGVRAALCHQAVRVTCSLSSGGHGFDYGMVEVGPRAGYWGAVPLTGSVRLFVPGAVHLYCSADTRDPNADASDAFIVSESLVATRVSDPLPPPRQPPANTHHLTRPQKPKVR